MSLAKSFYIHMTHVIYVIYLLLNRQVLPYTLKSTDNAIYEIEIPQSTTCGRSPQTYCYQRSCTTCHLAEVKERSISLMSPLPPSTSGSVPISLPVYFHIKWIITLPFKTFHPLSEQCCSKTSRHGVN